MSVTCPRTGQRPLAFASAALLASADSRANNGPASTRWWSVNLYRLPDDRHVVCLTFHTQWEGETDHHQAEVHPDLDRAFAALETIDPTAPMATRGYPDAQQFRAKQQAIEAAIRERYAEMISRLADDLELAETP